MAEPAAEWMQPCQLSRPCRAVGNLLRLAPPTFVCAVKVRGGGGRGEVVFFCLDVSNTPTPSPRPLFHAPPQHVRNALASTPMPAALCTRFMPDVRGTGGSIIGHIFPGLMLGLWAIHWTLGAFRAYFEAQCRCARVGGMHACVRVCVCVCARAHASSTCLHGACNSPTPDAPPLHRALWLPQTRACARTHARTRTHTHTHTCRGVPCHFSSWYRALGLPKKRNKHTQPHTQTHTCLCKHTHVYTLTHTLAGVFPITPPPGTVRCGCLRNG